MHGSACLSLSKTPDLVEIITMLYYYYSSLPDYQLSLSSSFAVKISVINITPLRRGLSTSIHSSAPRGLKSTYWFLYTNLKNTLSNCSYTYIDHKTCKKINIYNCYVRAPTNSFLMRHGHLPAPPSKSFPTPSTWNPSLKYDKYIS